MRAFGKIIIQISLIRASDEDHRRAAWQANLLCGFVRLIISSNYPQKGIHYWQLRQLLFRENDIVNWTS